ncbi:MAG: GNAT family N-acetyltransferase [Legionellaceae bacterium]|nr:GNAT family N-acetyltransferase [Legionellaceae bacterium]
MNLSIREPVLADANQFIKTMQNSVSLHSPWTIAPKTFEEFEKYITRCQLPNQKGFLVESAEGEIAGVFNISEIVLGCFQSGYLGYYATIDYVGKGVMSTALKLVLKNAFEEMKLHRIEANIQPGNERSIQLVKFNGFRKEGVSPRYLQIDGKWCDHERWAITYEDWDKRA